MKAFVYIAVIVASIGVTSVFAEEPAKTIRAAESKAVPEKIAFQLNRTYIADRDPAKRKARIERSLKTASRIRQSGTDREIDFRPAAAPVTIQDGGLKPRSSRLAKKSTGA